MRCPISICKMELIMNVSGNAILVDTSYHCPIHGRWSVTQLANRIKRDDEIKRRASK